MKKLKEFTIEKDITLENMIIVNNIYILLQLQMMKR